MKSLLKTLLLSAFLCAFAACSNDEPAVAADDFESLDEVITITRTITMPVTRAGRGGNFDLEITASLDVETERVIELKLRPISDDEALIMEFDNEFSMEDFHNVLAAELGPDYMDLNALETTLAQAQTSSETFLLSTCLSGCYERLTDENGKKLPGRGWCKFGCWMDWIKDIFERLSNKAW